MKAMILAAGEGRRMRPLTDNRPKPLLTVRGVSLLEHHIVRLRDAGVTSLVVNASHLGDQIEHFCGDGSAWGVTIQISREVQPLETAGGIVAALPHLGGEPFLVINGDVFTDFSFATLLKVRVRPRGGHLVLVDNPSHNPDGDFRLQNHKIRSAAATVEAGQAVATLTFSGIALYHPDFFSGCEPGKRKLKPLLDKAVEAELLSGQYFGGRWSDVGTPDRLDALNH